MEKSNAPGISSASDDRPICNIRHNTKFSSGYLNESRLAFYSLIEKNRRREQLSKSFDSIDREENQSKVTRFTRPFSKCPNWPDFISARNHVDYRQGRRCTRSPAPCSASISFTTRLPALTSLLVFPLRLFLFLEPYPHLPLHTTKPFGRYAAPSLQILYHFYEA